MRWSSPDQEAVTEVKLPESRELSITVLPLSGPQIRAEVSERGTTFGG
jgi:hypothetical protein